MSKLINGLIPARTECPYKDRCSLLPSCNHKGVHHHKLYSCAIARGFALIERNGGNNNA